LRLVEVQKEAAGYAERGANLIAIGQGTGDESADFARKWDVTIPILGDTSGSAYTAYGMHRGNWWTVVLRAMLTQPIETICLIAQADMAGAALPAADVLRLPGVAVIARGGALRYLHRAEDTADMPSNQAIFDRLATLEA
jgi:hypothetical protein